MWLLFEDVYFARLMFSLFSFFQEDFRIQTFNEWDYFYLLINIEKISFFFNQGCSYDDSSNLCRQNDMKVNYRKRTLLITSKSVIGVILGAINCIISKNFMVSLWEKMFPRSFLPKSNIFALCSTPMYFGCNRGLSSNGCYQPNILTPIISLSTFAHKITISPMTDLKVFDSLLSISPWSWYLVKCWFGCVFIWSYKWSMGRIL